MADVAITALVDEANSNAQIKGFYSIPRWNGRGEQGRVPAGEFNEYRHGITNEQLLHACIELGEAAQIFRKTGEFSDDLLEELADVFIVLADLIGRYEFDQRFADILVAKLYKNRQRPQAYGNAQAQAAQFPEVEVSVDGQIIEARWSEVTEVVDTPRDEWCCGNHGDCRCGGH